MFKRVRWGAAALLASSIGASAQTLPSPNLELNLGPSLGVWTGLYVGAGISSSKTKLGFPGGSGLTTLSDTTAPGVGTYSQPYGMDKDLFANGTFIDFGARYQLGRLVVGADFDMDFGGKESIAPTQGQLDGIAGVFTTGNYATLGLNSFGGVKTLGHLRAIVGYSVTPSIMMFGSAGVAKARFYETGVSASGAVASSPSAPIYGATTSSSVPGEKYGRSLGIGMDVKATDNVIARIEYINDHYDFPLTANAGFGGTVGEITVNSSITSSRVSYDVNTLRASLNYRFGPSDTSSEVAKLTSVDSYGKWGGFYAGFGATTTHNELETNGFNNVRISDAFLGQVYSSSEAPQRTGDKAYGHLLFGYLYQFSNSRIIVGAEYSHDIASEFDYRIPSVNQYAVTGINFITAPGTAQCGVYTPGAFTCVGGSFYGALKVTDHFRAIVGFEVLPSLMVFGSAGVARAKIEYEAVSNSGFVASPPSAPLVGKATVRKPQSEDVWANSFGGGVQYKLQEGLAIRVEYLRDSAEMSIRGAGGSGFGGTIGNQTTISFISPGTKESFVNESWRASLIFSY